ncbi:MAG: hypothetical protein V6Z82_02365 [Flavobacteriales bacterium]
MKTKRPTIKSKQSFIKRIRFTSILVFGLLFASAGLASTQAQADLGLSANRAVSRISHSTADQAVAEGHITIIIIETADGTTIIIIEEEKE